MSYSQLGQDDWVLEVINKPSGFFVEFGAADGVINSNTLLLEEHGWSGIVVESAKMWHKSLQKNRECHIDFSCISTSSGDTVKFTEAGEFSTLTEYVNSDSHFRRRQTKIEYDVDTISLQDLLNKYNAPKLIDYLSIDTEGSEFDILESYFKESTREILAITVEHNYTSAKYKIDELLTSLNYSQFNSNKSRWDAWYLLRSRIYPDLRF